MEDKIIQMAQTVIGREPKCRPEAEWIQLKVNRLTEREGTGSRGDTDRRIFEKMYGRTATKSDTVKIRYWRTGRHLPSGREEGNQFAKALGLDREETLYFFQAYMEKSDLVFEEPPEPSDPCFFLYESRRTLMERLISEYIEQVPPARIIQMNIPYDRLAAYARHLYCIDAVSATAFYASCRQQAMKNHFVSVNYESEFLRIRRLLGEIPRRTMLRHIFLLGIPYLNRRLIDERLKGLGYLPLTEGHTDARGALSDDLVIEFLKLYEHVCTGQDPLMCRQWLMEQLCTLDCYLKDSGREDYRFLYFRSLSAMVDDGEEL